MNNHWLAQKKNREIEIESIAFAKEPLCLNRNGADIVIEKSLKINFKNGRSYTIWEEPDDEINAVASNGSYDHGKGFDDDEWLMAELASIELRLRFGDIVGGFHSALFYMNNIIELSSCMSIELRSKVFDACKRRLCVGEK